MSTSLNRGDRVIVDFRPVNPRAGVRPALVVQNDRDNRRLTNTVVAQVSSNVRRASADTQLLIDERHSDWTASGLRHPSAVICSNLYTISRDEVARVIGTLSDTTMQQVNERLPIVLGLICCRRDEHGSMRFGCDAGRHPTKRLRTAWLINGSLEPITMLTRDCVSPRTPALGR